MVDIDAFKPGSYTLSKNLIFRKKPSGAASWVFRYSKDNKLIEIGLGSYPKTSFVEAEMLASRMRASLLNNEDPKKVIGELVIDRSGDIETRLRRLETMFSLLDPEAIANSVIQMLEGR